MKRAVLELRAKDLTETSPKGAIDGTGKSPGGGQGVGGVLAIGNLAPTAVPEVGVGQLVRDDVVGKFDGAMRKAWAQNDGTVTAGVASRTLHPDDASPPGHKIFDGY